MLYVLISEKATVRGRATAWLNTLSPAGEQPDLPSPTQRMLGRLHKGSLVAGRSSWHPLNVRNANDTFP